ncbi:MAG: class I SAM-dependent methyltransferase, partial [Acidobacteria bacterium]|nr:class I SAM-dependent methyltransferase [Acidobacteriota bacterium]
MNRMADPGQLSPSVFYRLAAEIGFRRHFHFGGLEATAQLMNLCLLEANHRVLDIGCASGKTACHVAGRYGCRVTGVDVLPEMIARANERAQREGVQDRVLFHAADARNLPFEAGLFDVVIGEFIVGLLDDRDKGVGEALRVARPGGIVGLNEATWLATPVPEDVVRYMSGTFGVKGGLLTAAEWVDLLNGVGL